MPYETAAALCLSLNDANQRLGCFHGYGLRYSKKASLDPPFILTLCCFGSLEDRQMCVEGAAGKIDNFDRNLKYKVCELIDDVVLRKSCFEAENEGMNKDANRYYYVALVAQ